MWVFSAPSPVAPNTPATAPVAAVAVAIAKSTRNDFAYGIAPTGDWHPPVPLKPCGKGASRPACGSWTAARPGLIFIWKKTISGLPMNWPGFAGNGHVGYEKIMAPFLFDALVKSI